MDPAEALLLDALRCAVRGEKLHISEKPEQSTLRRLYRVAQEQFVLPLITHVLYTCPVLMGAPYMAQFRQEARRQTLTQATQTADCLVLLRELEALGLQPLVLKGSVCRSLYPQPEQRPSTDVDFLIPPQDFARYQDALLSCGFLRKEPDKPVGENYEVTFVDRVRYLYLELHLQPFSDSDEAFGFCNHLFSDAYERRVPFQLYGQTFFTLSPTDHLLFLICHAYKHVLYGGVGIRQICDICLFAERYSEQVDWQALRSSCEELRILSLTAAFFCIGEQQLSIPAPSAFSDLKPDTEPLLRDCLSGGVFGSEDPDRLRSSRITLDAVAAGREGRAQRGVWNSIFPGKAYLQSNFHYARKHPVLLPFAWAHRLWNYAFHSNLSASKSLRIGRERVELLRKYQIIP